MKKFDVYEDRSLNSTDLEIRRLSKINYRIAGLELLNVIYIGDNKYTINFVNKTGNLNQNDSLQPRITYLIVKDSISIMGKTYLIEEGNRVVTYIYDETGIPVKKNTKITFEDIDIYIELYVIVKQNGSIIIEKISLIVKKGFNDKCSRCNRPSTMFASDNRRYCSVECFEKICSVCGKLPGIQYWNDNYYCKKCFSDLVEQIDLSELKVF